MHVIISSLLPPTAEYLTVDPVTGFQLLNGCSLDVSGRVHWRDPSGKSSGVIVGVDVLCDGLQHVAIQRGFFDE